MTRNFSFFNDKASFKQEDRILGGNLPRNMHNNLWKLHLPV